MIRREVVGINPLYSFYNSPYEEFEDTRGGNTNSSTMPQFSLSDFILVRPVRGSLVGPKNYYKSEVTCTSDKLEDFIAKRIFKIPAVECIFFSTENDLIEIRTVINKYDKAIAKNIYAAEYDLLETFNDIFFDFLIIYRDDREINEIHPSESVIIFRR